MDRRTFLKHTIPAAAIVNCGLGGLLISGKQKGESSEPLNKYDLVVCGGSLAGCFSAMHAARKGMNVLLVERRTFLATDITATLRPWLDRRGFEDWSPEMKELFLPEGEKPEVGVPGFSEADFGRDIPLFAGSVKKQFMISLLEEGVHILLMSGMWGVLSDSDQKSASGVILANKFGNLLVHGRQVIDTTGWLLQNNPSEPVNHSFSLEFFDIKEPVENEIKVPASLGMTENVIRVHKGKRAKNHYFVEFGFIPEQEDAEHEARMKTEVLCGHLRREHASFANARMNQMAWETMKPGDETASAGNYLYKNYHVFHVGNKGSLSCRDVTDINEEAAALVNRISNMTEPQTEPAAIYHHGGEIPFRACRMSDIEDIKLNLAIEQIEFPYEDHVPESMRVNVIVAGGGTAGAMSAMGAFEKGAITATVEYFPELGGTKTMGGVAGWYWGYKKTELFNIFENGYKEISKTLGGKVPSMMAFFRKNATQGGNKLLTRSIICGVIKDGRKVTGIVVEREGALSIISGDVIIDATGDADVAVFAGADFEYGNERMNVTQNYSQWSQNPRENPPMPSTDRSDYDIIMNHQISELQRGYRLSHMQSHYYDFKNMLTVRESRRIQGDFKITLRDIIDERKYPDTICLTQSNYDPHTFGDTAPTRAGCLLVFDVAAIPRIPYRAILPRRIEGMLISGKAISQTHNALQFTRMSFDIMTMGYVTGWIAALSSMNRTALKDFDVSSIQQDLVDMKILRPGDVADAYEEKDISGLAEQRIAELTAGKKHSLLKVIMLPAGTAEPLLKQEFEASAHDAVRLRLAKALAWFGNPIGNSLLLLEMKNLRKEEINTGFLPREHQPEDVETPYWPVNQDIALLGISGDKDVIPDILEIADSLNLNNPPVTFNNQYKDSRIDWTLIPWYNRIINICFAIERMPDTRAIDSLSRFLYDPYIGGNITREPESATRKVFPGILESRIAATLARCGSRQGFDVLVKYLDDEHHMLTAYARQELASILAKDFGTDARKWNRYIAGLDFPTPRVSKITNIDEW